MDPEKAQEKKKALQEKLAKVTEEIRQEEKVAQGKEPDKEKIEGYEMVEEKPEDTKVTVSGSSWIIIRRNRYGLADISRSLSLDSLQKLILIFCA